METLGTAVSAWLC